MYFGTVPLLKDEPYLKNAISFGANFAAGIGVFCFIGYKVGKKTGHQTLFTLLGFFLGMAYGGYELWKIVRRLNQAENHGTKNNKPR
jgi:hypothetical protein